MARLAAAAGPGAGVDTTHARPPADSTVMTARTARNVALDDQVSAVLRDATESLSTVEVAARLRMTGTAQQLRDVWLSLDRLARAGYAERIVVRYATCRYWRRPA
jgi:hypothetical protein